MGDPDHQKHFKMPIVAVKNALLRDGKDPMVIDLGPEKYLKSQTDAGSKKEKSIKKSQPRKNETATLKEQNGEATRKDSEAKDQSKKNADNSYFTKKSCIIAESDCAKYFKMLKIGLPMGAVKNALVRDGKDPMVIDLDPEKYLKSQTDAGSKKEKSIKKSQP